MEKQNFFIFFYCSIEFFSGFLNSFLRANLRVLNLQNFLHLRQDFDIYNEKVNDLYGDFAKMMKLEANSIELKAYFSKYEEIMESKYDPQMIIGLKNIFIYFILIF